MRFLVSEVPLQAERSRPGRVFTAGTEKYVRSIYQDSRTAKKRRFYLTQRAMAAENGNLLPDNQRQRRTCYASRVGGTRPCVGQLNPAWCHRLGTGPPRARTDAIYAESQGYLAHKEQPPPRTLQ